MRRRTPVARLTERAARAASPAPAVEPGSAGSTPPEAVTECASPSSPKAPIRTRGGRHRHVVRAVGEGLPTMRSDVVAVVAHPFQRTVHALPPNVRTLRSVPLWGAPAHVDERRTRAPRSGEPGRSAPMTSQLRLSSFPPGLSSTARFWRPEPAPAALHDAFLDLHEFLVSHNPDQTFACKAIFQTVADEWSTAAPAHARPTVRDVIEVVHILRRLLSVLALPPLEADVVHGTAAGVSSLLGLVAKAKRGTHYILTEHGVLVREAFWRRQAVRFERSAEHARPLRRRHGDGCVLRGGRGVPRRAARQALGDGPRHRSRQNPRGLQRRQPTGTPRYSLSGGAPDPRLGGSHRPSQGSEDLTRAAAIVRTEQRDIRVDIYGAVPRGTSATTKGSSHFGPSSVSTKPFDSWARRTTWQAPTPAGTSRSSPLSQKAFRRRGRGDDERAPRGGYRSRARARDTR